MATYVFESMTDSQAANFTAADSLIFLSAGADRLGVQDNPSVTSPLQTTAESIVLTDDAGHHHTFNALELAAADDAGHFTFVNGDVVALGTSQTDDEINGLGSNYTFTDLGHAAFYGFDGEDTIYGSTANDTINGGEGDDTINGSSSFTDSDGNYVEADYLQGGNGADSITGGDGNDHIYGNLFSSVAGDADGNDTVLAGAGNDYVNGMVGNDSILGEDGNDRLFGGQGNDIIDGGIGNDYLQGNKGNDVLTGDDGNDILHGGQGNDSLDGGNDNDQLFGDNGNDDITGGLGYDTLTGGAGNDVFHFAAGDADNGDVGGDNQTDVVMDFDFGHDSLEIGFTVTGVIHGSSGATFTDLEAAQDYAQSLLTGHGTEVAAITVGTDTYLFYDSTHTTGDIDSVIKVAGAGDASFDDDGGDFI
jgi:serralysin